MSSKTLIAGGLLIAIAVVVLTLFGRSRSSDSLKDAKPKYNQSVDLSSLEREKIELTTSVAKESVANLTIPVAGDLIPVPGKSLIVTAPFSGTLKAIEGSPRLGGAVKKGSALFSLIPSTGVQRDLKTTLKAELESALARFENAKQQLARTKVLYEGKATSKKSLELAEQEEIQSKALYNASEKRFGSAKINPFDADVELSIMSPFDGVLIRLHGVNGQVIQAGAPLFEIADLSSLWLKIPIYSGDAERLRELAEIEVQHGRTQKTLKAERVNGPLTADPLTFTTDFYFEINNNSEEFRPGERLIALVPRNHKKLKVVSVPESSIVYDLAGSEWVYLEENSRFKKQKVSVLEVSNETALISQGLEAGQTVVRDGAAELLGIEAGMNKK